MPIFRIVNNAAQPTYEGFCLYKTDVAGHCSIMTVWNPELKCPERIELIDDRKDLISIPDASDATKREYEAWMAKKSRATGIQVKWAKRRQDILLARQTKLQNYLSVRRLQRGLSPDNYVRAIALLKVQKFRKTDRSTLAGMLRAWANDPCPKFPTPLSPRQLKTL